MAKLYGNLVGTPVQGILKTGSGFVSEDYKDGRDLILWRDVATTSGNVIGDQISLGLFPSKTWFDPLWCNSWNDAFGAGVTASCGDVTYPSALFSARSLTAAAAGRVFPVTAVSYGQPLWQRLGYPTDPGVQLELLMTFAGANPANGNFGWELYGRRH